MAFVFSFCFFYFKKNSRVDRLGRGPASQRSSSTQPQPAKPSEAVRPLARTRPAPDPPLASSRCPRVPRPARPLHRAGHRMPHARTHAKAEPDRPLPLRLCRRPTGGPPPPTPDPPPPFLCSGEHTRRAAVDQSPSATWQLATGHAQEFSTGPGDLCCCFCFVFQFSLKTSISYNSYSISPI